MENATLIWSLTFTAPPAIFTGVIPKSDCFSSAVPTYKLHLLHSPASNEIG